MNRYKCRRCNRPFLSPKPPDELEVECCGELAKYLGKETRKIVSILYGNAVRSTHPGDYVPSGTYRIVREDWTQTFRNQAVLISVGLEEGEKLDYYAVNHGELDHAKRNGALRDEN